MVMDIGLDSNIMVFKILCILNLNGWECLD